MSECLRQGDSKVPATPVPLRRNRRFQTLWIGAAAANLGLEAVEVAYPLLIMSLTGSPALAGLFGFAQIGTALLVGLPAGAVVDRWDRRRILLISEAVRALTLAFIVLGLTAGWANFGLLILAAIVLGAGTAFGAPARMLLIRAVVPDHQLTAALSQDEARSGAAALAGPPLGGALYLVSRTFPFVAAIVGFVISFACTLVIRLPEAEKPTEPVSNETKSALAPLTTAFSGLLELISDRLLRSALLLISIFYFSITAAILMVMVTLRDQHHSPGTIGLALSGTAVGMLVGSALVTRLNRLLSPGALLLSASTLTTVAVALLALPLGPVWVFAMLTLAALGLPALKILVDIMIFRQTPDHRRGRAIAATITLIGAGSPLGSLVGGLALQFLGVTGAIALIAGVQAVITVAGLASRHVRSARWPA
ncbi:MFS transporter [Streptomyces sp. NBC_00654]|uniref:MFS transporter n=1 Tax=Streptomyces sp. NBC_00654 TaxID=2975799 RepID=UPI002254DDCE|nr:MFS transporter [Streptomyces sp. NBC_00654]MCX4967321.1 MFS transporter [Streptomyces sp. NBC_00654]